MVFIELKNKTNINVIHISKIYQDNTDIILESAKGSLTDIREHYDTFDEASARYQKLQDALLVK